MSKVLYLQHADSVGGSVISLRELVIDARDNNYDCTVVCVNEEVAIFYNKIGVKTIISKVVQFNHNTAFHYRLTSLDILRFARLFIKTLSSFVMIIRIVRKVKPDIVHLNSLTLVHYSFLFYLIGIQTILHVREMVVNGYFGFRKKMIGWAANRFSRHIIYISEYEYSLLNTKREKSHIIYNYVHKNTFLESNTGTEVIDRSAINVVSLGGLASLKGGIVLLKFLKASDRKVHLWIAGCDDPRINGASLLKREGKEYYDSIMSLLMDERISSRVTFFGKIDNPEKLVSKSDALLFWADRPHFPRPVFEAWLLQKPVLYHNPSFQNPYITKWNVTPIENDDDQTLNRIADSFKNGVLAKEILLDNYSTAVRVFTEANFSKINNLYKVMLQPQSKPQ